MNNHSFYATQDHKDSIDMIEYQLQSLDESKEILLSQLDTDDITDIEKMEIHFQLKQYDIAREQAVSQLNEYKTLRVAALN